MIAVIPDIPIAEQLARVRDTSTRETHAGAIAEPRKPFDAAKWWRELEQFYVPELSICRGGCPHYEAPGTDTRERCVRIPKTCGCDREIKMWAVGGWGCPESHWAGKRFNGG